MSELNKLFLPTLIETLTLGATAQNADFVSVLDGDADEAYIIEGTMICGAAFAEMALQPNSLATNQRFSFLQTSGAVVSGSAGAGTMLLAPSILDVDGQGTFRAYFYAKSGLRRWGFSEGYSVNAAFGGNDLSIRSSFQWSDTATNVTSIRLAGDRANAQKIGSIYRLYRTKLERP